MTVTIPAGPTAVAIDGARTPSGVPMGLINCMLAYSVQKPCSTDMAPSPADNPICGE
jgi:hypothetical protein